MLSPLNWSKQIREKESYKLKFTLLWDKIASVFILGLPNTTIYEMENDHSSFHLNRVLLLKQNMRVNPLYIQGCGVGVGVGGVACFQLESESGVGVGFQNCWSRSRFFKTAGVGVGSRFLKLLESESGVGVGKFVAITDSNVY